MVQLLNCTRSAYSLWEINKNTIPLYYLNKLSNCLNINIDYLVDLSEKKYIEFDKYVEGFENILNKLKSLYDINLLRNVSKHEVEYYKRNGNKQKEFINDNFNQSIIRPLIIDDVYYISGKININELKSILEELEIILNSNNHNFKIEAIPVLNELVKESIA